jgi:hypothetical protein
VQVSVEFVLYAIEPLRGSPGVRSNVTAPDGEIVCVTHALSLNVPTRSRPSGHVPRALG